MRWEVIIAGVMLLGFWATSFWTFAKVRDGGPYWWLNDLAVTIPAFVLCPIFAISGLGNPRTSTAWRWCAVVIMLCWLFSPQTWYVMDYIWRTAR
jgi:hypothetical protein